MLAALMASITKKSANRVVYPVNKPGQNAWECYTLSGLTFIMLMGYFMVLIGELFGAGLGSYLLGALIALALTFIALHLVLIIFSLIYHVLKSIQFFPPSAPQQIPLGIYLFALTLFALALFCSGKVVWMLIALPWLIGLVLNSACESVFFFKNFIAQLQGGESES
ncbi:MAG: hypothetical protein L3J39_03675 [Verrucomicrobiales bacterium]|nr:hypothetical protein [Verrucomicrobiales bacterium]